MVRKGKITFIVGSSRSGTSILGEIFANHPKFMYIFEDGVWEKFNHKDHHVANDSDITFEEILKIREHFNNYKHTNIVEKNPRHITRIKLIKRVFPVSKIIHIVRDGRDVACSLRSGLCGKSWAHVKPENWKEIESNYDGVIRCAHAWKEIMEIAIKDLKTIPHHQVKYEDLIFDTKKTVEEIFDYLGYDVHDDVYEFLSKIQNDRNISYEAKNQTRWSTDDNSIRTGRWKENMSDEEKVYVNKLLEPILKYYKYL